MKLGMQPFQHQRGQHFCVTYSVFCFLCPHTYLPPHLPPLTPPSPHTYLPHTSLPLPSHLLPSHLSPLTPPFPHTSSPHTSLPSHLPPLTPPSPHTSLPSHLPPLTPPSLHTSLPSCLPPLTPPSHHTPLPSHPHLSPSLAHLVHKQTDVDDLLPPIYMYGAHATSSSPRDTYVKPDVSSSLRDQRLNSVSEETSSRRPDTLLSSEAPGKTTEVHHLEAYASVYERRTNLNTTEVPKKAESQPLEPPAMRVSDHLQEYVTMTPTSDPGTLEGGAFANLQQRISRLEESRKEYERNIEQVHRPVWFDALMEAHVV